MFGMFEEVGDILRELGLRKRGHDIVPNFCGWLSVSDYMKKCTKPEIAYFAAIAMETGGRISELLSYRPTMFKYSKTENGLEVIKCEGLPVLKKGAKASATKKIRNIMIPVTEPLVTDMMEGVSNAYKKSRLFPWKDRTYVWRLITKTDPYWWPHRFRTERASQLVVEYGFDVALLMKFFNWSRAEEAVGYVRLSAEDIVDKMVKKNV
jgi:hypothetical protein